MGDLIPICNRLLARSLEEESRRFASQLHEVLAARFLISSELCEETISQHVEDLCRQMVEENVGIELRRERRATSQKFTQ